MRVLIACLLAVLSGAPRAELLELAWDNDILFSTDGTYTNGVRLGWLSDEYAPQDCLHCLRHLASRSLAFLPGMNGASNHAVGVYVQQSMLTPSDISIAAPQYDDVPYAGVLRGTVSLLARTSNTVTRYGMSLGVIGPNSGAESMQVRIHKLTNSQLPRGWDTQVGEKTLVGVNFGQARRLQRWTLDNGRELEWGAGAVGEIDNFYSYVRAGAFMRYGRALPANLLPDYASIGSNASLSGLLVNKNYGWSVFAGFSGEYVGYNYFDSNPDGYRTNQESFLGSLIVGASAHTPDFHVSLSLRETTSTIKNARRPLRFGTLSLVWKR